MKKNQSQQTPDKASPTPTVSAIAGAATPATPQFLFSAQIAATQQMSGPIPPPEMLRQYEQLSPGLIDRIVKMAEDEASHRRATELEAIAIQSRDQKAYRRSELFGQVFGLTIGVVAIICSALMAVHGAQMAASIIGTGGVTGLVTAFIVGRSMLLKQKEQDFQQQMQAQQLHRSSAATKT